MSLVAFFLSTGFSFSGILALRSIILFISSTASKGNIPVEVTVFIIIRDKLKSYKKYIDPQKYKTLHKQLNILEKQNERAVERLNIRQVKDFSNKLSGYTNCVTTTSGGCYFFVNYSNH
jgi:DNA gyrase/topoisomerase IV subunit B